ncbi:hypothetical protein OUZ56_022383 [Daphnia magna]|uniref:GMPS ATP-PPase domain-containing protein n=1 Tax=Daphnia magna TaxID=35525 RepID=A0ABR0AW75_9CRUS|nr:hypothetical protein OUZ56_022383 [Daphnia magna]
MGQNGDLFHDFQLPRQTPTHKTIRVREQCVESEILALETLGAFLLQQGYNTIIISGGFILEKREQQCNHYIWRTIGRDKIVFMLVSGGVDSAVCAALLHKALLQGDDSSRVQTIHIDNGFLRKD